MNCPRCQSPVGENSLFCAHCGATLTDEARDGSVGAYDTDDIEKTMTIPAVRPQTVAVRETDAVKPAPSGRKSPAPKHSGVSAPAKSNAKTSVLVVVIAFLITLVAGLGITLAAVLISSSPDKAQVDNPPALQVGSTEQDKEQEKEETEEPEELPVGESVGTEEKTGITIDTGFDFSLGGTVASSELSYKTLKSTEFGYKCDIPAAFKFVSDADGEIRYRAEDKTAYMDIGAFANDHSLTYEEIKSMVSKELGGAVDYEDSGEDWFIMRTISRGVVYYFKCYADEFIRYVEFVYPAEYKDVYDVYVSDIEPTFVRTN